MRRTHIHIYIYVHSVAHIYTCMTGKVVGYNYPFVWPFERAFWPSLGRAYGSFSTRRKRAVRSGAQWQGMKTTTHMYESTPAHM